jgi:Tetratricopeptide repeat
MMAKLSATYKVQGDLKDAEKAQRQLLDIGRHTLGPDHQDTLDSMELLAITLNDQGHSTESEKLMSEELEIQRRTLGPENSHTLQTTNNLGGVLKDEARYSDAKKCTRMPWTSSTLLHSLISAA